MGEIIYLKNGLICIVKQKPLRVYILTNLQCMRLSYSGGKRDAKRTKKLVEKIRRDELGGCSDIYGLLGHGMIFVNSSEHTVSRLPTLLT